MSACAVCRVDIVGVTLLTARDLVSLKIRVVIIAPGLFNTSSSRPCRTTLSARRSAGRPRNWSRLGDPAEYATLTRPSHLQS
jgi:NAD(P)-dependent dehydrogenase (short-subunit alcohol dehydrogenase family)